MLDSIKDWFVDRLHKYMDAAREIVENNEGIRSAETYYSTVKATLKKETVSFGLCGRGLMTIQIRT